MASPVVVKVKGHIGNLTIIPLLKINKTQNYASCKKFVRQMSSTQMNTSVDERPKMMFGAFKAQKQDSQS